MIVIYDNDNDNYNDNNNNNNNNIHNNKNKKHYILDPPNYEEAIRKISV